MHTCSIDIIPKKDFCQQFLVLENEDTTQSQNQNSHFFRISFS
jgi:hypothetical protein